MGRGLGVGRAGSPHTKIEMGWYIVRLYDGASVISHLLSATWICSNYPAHSNVGSCATAVSSLCT